MLAVSDPREGLPPCLVRAARLDNRVAWWGEANRCRCWNISARMDVGFGVLTEPQASHDVLCRDWYISGQGSVRTDDPDEAQAAFERGAEWVRTGEGP